MEGLYIKLNQSQKLVVIISLIITKQVIFELLVIENGGVFY
jgi:hypothetical protein